MFDIHAQLRLYSARIRDLAAKVLGRGQLRTRTLFFARQTREADKGSYNLIANFEEVLYE